MGDIFLMVFLIGIPIGFVMYSTGKVRALWLGCLFGMMAVLGGCEAYSKFVDPAHKTISQHFATLSPGSQIAIAVCLAIAWTGLLFHLLWPLIVKTFSKKNASDNASADSSKDNEA